jgi:DNA-binding PadR family transcriptional regulator
MHDLTAFQRDLLLAISGLDEPKGLDVKDVLEEYYGTEIRHGRLYPNLDTLVEEGYVEKGKVDRRTNFYRLSEWGLGELEARRRWEDERLGTTIST